MRSYPTMKNRFLIIPHKYFQTLNQLKAGEISSISCLVVLLLSYYLRTQNNYKIRTKFDFNRTFNLDLKQLTRYFFPALDYQTCKARFVSALTELNYFEYVSFKSGPNEILQLSFSEALLDLMLPDEKNKNDLWYSVPLQLFSDPMSLLSSDKQSDLKKRLNSEDRDLINEYIFKKLKGNNLLLLIELLGHHCNNWIISPDDVLTDDVVISNNRFSWNEIYDRIISHSGLECGFSSSNQSNTESHRFYRGLKLLSNLGFICYEAVRNSVSKIVYVSLIKLNNVLSNVSRNLNSGRKQAYKEGIMLNKQQNMTLKALRRNKKFADKLNSLSEPDLYTPSPQT